jgi:hypothetical protein
MQNIHDKKDHKEKIFIPWEVKVSKTLKFYVYYLFNIENGKIRDCKTKLEINNANLPKMSHLSQKMSTFFPSLKMPLSYFYITISPNVTLLSSCQYVHYLWKETCPQQQNTLFPPRSLLFFLVFPFVSFCRLHKCATRYRTTIAACRADIGLEAIKIHVK